MKKIDPTQPLRSDHRIMLFLLKDQKPKVEPTPKQLNRLARVFERYGGDWQKLYQGDSSQTNKLRKVLDVAVKKGFITKASKWV